ncbi:GGDEF domain-containing protein [Candidatus Microgenomates bacterium]|nr:GGDEF domain-containing protein [Candidatus Microgenomates bacterium]
MLNNRELKEKLAKDSVMKVSSRHELEKQFKSIEVSKEPAGLLFIDIDNFKEVNDEFGHGVGDKVLELVGERIINQVSKDILVGRWGGDEILVVFPKLEDALVLEERANEIRNTIKSKPFKMGDAVLLSRTLSIGAAIKEAGETTKDWLKRADASLYEAKETGRDKVVMAK